MHKERKFSAIFFDIADNLHIFAAKMANTTQYIMDYAVQNRQFCIDDIVNALPKVGQPSLTSIKSTITRLVESNRIARVRRGLYALVGQQKDAFRAVVSDKELEINRLLKERFPFATFCIYNGATFAPLQHHLSQNNLTYVETERAAMESVFNFLREQGYETFLKPNADFMTNYVDMTSSSVVVKPLISEAPTMKQGEVTVPTLEKLLIDIQKDADLSYLHGMEAEYMIENAQALYTINETRLSRYGRRRSINKHQNKSL